MKKLLFSFCVLFSLSNISYAQGIELKEVEIKLEAPQEFKKGEPIEIKPKTPLPVYGIATGLCFAIGKPFLIGKTTEEQKEKTKAVLLETFGDLKIENPYLPGPAFIEGFAIESKDIKSSFGNQSLPAWKLLVEMGLSDKNIHNAGQLSVCASLMTNLNSVESIRFVPVQNFKAEYVYWSTSNVAEYVKKIRNSP